MRYSHLDLFSGIGGFALAALMLNNDRNIEILETKQFVEIDPYCQKLLSENFPRKLIHHDITQYLTESLNIKYSYTDFDIITGGFPCQDLSVSGKGKGLNGSKSGLWFEYLRLIELIKPSAIVIENVTPNRKQSWLLTVLENLSNLGYNALWRTFRAFDFGKPHRRKRLFIVAFKNTLPVRDQLIFNQFFGRLPTLPGIDRHILNSSGHVEILARITQWQEVNCVLDGKPSKEDKDRVHSLGNALIPAIAQFCLETVVKLLDLEKTVLSSFPGIPYSVQIPSDFAYLKHGMILNGVIHPKTVLASPDSDFKGLLRTPTASYTHRMRIWIETLKRECENINRQGSLVHNVAAALNRYPSEELYEWMMGFPVGWTKV